MGILDFFSDGSYRNEAPPANVYGDSYLARNKDRTPASVEAIQDYGEFLPFYGDLYAAGEAADAWNNNQKIMAGLLGAGAIVGGVPVVGDYAAAGIKRLAPYAGDALGYLDNFARFDEDGSMPTGLLDDLTGLGWRDRIEQSVPKSWTDPKYRKDQWHPISNVASKRSEADMLPIHTETDTLVPETSLNLEDLQGKYIIPALGDRSVAGVNIEGVSDMAYGDFIRSLGGADFMRELGTGVWANDFKPAQDLADTAQRVLDEGGDPLMVYTAMGPQSGDFSTMMMDSVINQVNLGYADPTAAAAFDSRAQKFVPAFEGLLSPRLRENLANDLTGTQRWRLWQELDRAAFRDAGLPDMGLARRSITDPRLLNATPFDSGLTVGRMTGGLLDNPEVNHPSYNTQIDGEYIGGIDPVAGPIMWRDFFDARRSSGAATGSDQRSFLMNSPRISQLVDQQMIDEEAAMREAVRGLNDPYSPLNLWRARDF